MTVVRTVATGLGTPWGLAPLPDGDLLVSSRDDATITRVDGKTGRKTELGEVPGVSPRARAVCWASPCPPSSPRTT